VIAPKSVTTDSLEERRRESDDSAGRSHSRGRRLERTMLVGVTLIILTRLDEPLGRAEARRP
jgi:hypothetical protein